NICYPQNKLHLLVEFKKHIIMDFRILLFLVFLYFSKITYAQDDTVRHYPITIGVSFGDPDFVSLQCQYLNKSAPFRVGISGTYIPHRNVVYTLGSCNIDYYLTPYKTWHAGMQYAYREIFTKNDGIDKDNGYTYIYNDIYKTNIYGLYGGFDIRWNRLLITPQVGAQLQRTIFNSYEKIIYTNNSDIREISIPYENLNQNLILPLIRIHVGFCI
ncbi:MAG TPA: hypothetical protein PLS12_08410, partial [Bacteroidales bacterium]|nr:hypothetical protein [Bacteroidales bacterium]